MNNKEHREQPPTPTELNGFVFSKLRFTAYMSHLTADQKAKLLNEAIAEAAELPQTMEAVA